MPGQGILKQRISGFYCSFYDFDITWHQILFPYNKNNSNHPEILMSRILYNKTER